MIMRRVLAVVCAAFCLGLGVGPGAMGGRAQAAATSSDPMSALMAQIATSLKPYQVLAADSVKLLSLTLEGASRAAEAESGAPPAWLDDWKVRLAAQRAVVQRERDTLQPFRPGGLTNYASDPMVARMIKALTQIPDTMRRLADSTLATADEALPLVDRAANGDRQAQAGLLRVTLSGAVENLDAQDAMLDFGGMFGSMEHPQLALGEGIKGQNQAMRLLLNYRIAQLSGESPDPVATLAAVRTALAQSRSDLAKVRPQAARLLARISATPMSPEYKARLKTAFETYGASADVELRIDQLIEDNTDIFLSATPAPGSGEAFDRQVSALSQQRMSLQQQRQASLTQ